jgi:hypothetical protein
MSTNNPLLINKSNNKDNDNDNDSDTNSDVEMMRITSTDPSLLLQIDSDVPIKTDVSLVKSLVRDYPHVVTFYKLCSGIIQLSIYLSIIYIFLSIYRYTI